MKSILLVDNEQKTLSSYLSEVIDEYDFNVDELSCQSLPEFTEVDRFSCIFLLVTENNTNKILSFLSNIRSTRIILILDGNLYDYEPFLNKVSRFSAGVIWSLEWPVEMLSMSLRMVDQTIDRFDLEFLNSELGLLQEQFVMELDKTKKLHLDMIPKRYQRYKGLNVYTKYVVGEQGGGEFFDFAQNNSQTLIFMCQANSYMGTSLAMMAFSDFKHQDEFGKDDLAFFLKDLKAKLIKEGMDQNHLSVFLYLFNHATHKVDGYSLGGYDILGDNIGSFASNQDSLFIGNIEDSYFSSQLKKDTQQIILSPGFRSNFETIDEYYEALKKIRVLKNEEAFETLNEIFMFVPEAGNTKFFKKDITTLLIEVEANAIFKL